MDPLEGLPPGFPRPIYIEHQRSMLSGMLVLAMLLACQTTAALHYTTTYASDKRVYKLVVHSTWATSALSCAGFIYAVWMVLVENAGDYNYYVHYNAGFKISAVGTAISVCISQTFYAIRAYTISERKRWVLFVGALLTIATGVANMGEMVVRSELKTAHDIVLIQPWVHLSLWSTFAADLFLVSVVGYHLRRKMCGANDTTNLAAGRFITLALQCALPTVFAAIGGAVLFVLYPTTPAFVPCYVAIGPLYALGILYMLNSRKAVVAQGDVQAEKNRLHLGSALHLQSPGLGGPRLASCLSCGADPRLAFPDSSIRRPRSPMFSITIVETKEVDAAGASESVTTLGLLGEPQPRTPTTPTAHSYHDWAPPKDKTG